MVCDSVCIYDRFRTNRRRLPLAVWREGRRVLQRTSFRQGYGMNHAYGVH